MARIGVTAQDVADAVARLKLQGKNPTVALIREFLGTGSNSTISRHLKLWRENQFNLRRETVPESIPDSLIPFIEAFWQESLKQADKRFAEKEHQWLKSKDAMQAMLDDFELELNKALNANELLKHELAEKRKLIK